MNDRERVLRLLNGQQPDRVPWFGDLAYWAGARIQRREVPENFYGSQAYMDWHRELRVGYYLQGHEPYAAHYEGVEVRDWREGHEWYREYQTPKGTLREMWQFLPESFTIAPAEHLIKSEADLPAFRFLLEHTTYRAFYDEAERLKGLIGDLGVLLCYTPKSPLMNLVALQAGIETVTRLMVNAGEALAETLALMDEVQAPACELAIASPAECLMIPENLSSEVVGKGLFEMYMRGYQERWTERIRQAGKFSFIHIDGTLGGLLAEEASVGFTVLEALTPKPCGDLSIHELARVAGNDKVILWGGIPGVYFTAHVSGAEFDRHVREVLGVMRREPRWVLGVADQVPPDALPERVARVADLADEYGIY